MIPSQRGTPKSVWSLRATLQLLLFTMGLYAIGISAFLALRLGYAAAELRRGSEPIQGMVEDVANRSHAMTSAAYEVQRALLRPQVSEHDAITAIRASLKPFRGQQLEVYRDVPVAVREPLFRANIEASKLESEVYEILDLMQFGRTEQVRARVQALDSLQVRLNGLLVAAEVSGLQDLAARQAELAAASTQTTRAITLWLVVGALFLPVVWIIARRRVWRPLADLQHGLTRVAEGDLRVEVPVRRHDEMGQLASHFNSMTDVLRQQAEEQGRFAAAGQLIAGVAHEVNNPLMAIATLGELRLDDPTISAEHRTELQHIVRQARRAGRLLAGLLRFVRTDTSGIETSDVNHVCQEAVDLVSYRFGHEEITLEMQLDPDLPAAHGDPNRIEQVLVNLLSNALDALVRVEVPRRLRVRTHREGEMIHLAVEDNGPGIDPHMVSRLFRPFSTTKGKHGTGLGLYISRQIVRDLGGDLCYEPAAGRGARFVVGLRAAAADGLPDRDADVDGRPEAVKTLAGLRVLLVDDESAIRRPLARFLKGRGAEVVEAADGVEALRQVRRHVVDLILADLRMPRMDGSRMYAELAATRPELAARTIFLTGDLAHIKESAGTTIDPKRVLLKPVKLSEVEERLLAVCAQHGLRQGT